MITRADLGHADSSPSVDGSEPAEALLPDNESDFRVRRRCRVAEAHRRTTLLAAVDPTADPQLVTAIAAADRLWGPDEQWRQAIKPRRAANLTRAGKTAPSADDSHQGASTGSVFGRFRVPRPRWGRPPARPTRAPVSDGRGATPGPDPGADQPMPVESFDVPLPGKPAPRIGRPRSWATRLTLIAAPLILIGGVAFSCGVSAGSDRLVQPSSISPDDAAAYHLSTFPAQRAAAFGVSYLTVCLTHPAPTDSTALTDRLAALARMASAGVTTGCGWTNGTAASAPAAIVWDGTAKPLQNYSNGSAALLGYAVTTGDGRTFGVSIPIWVTAGINGFRVVGDLAIAPAVAPAAAPTPAAPGVTDPMVADSLTAGVLVPFLRARGASDGVQLNLVLSRDATLAARTGMDNQLSNPAVSRTQVVVIRGDPQGYRDGDQLTALVLVDWTTRTSGAQRTGYSIQLRMSAGRWQVVDMTGAAPDVTGGAAPGTTFASPPPATPAAG